MVDIADENKLPLVEGERTIPPLTSVRIGKNVPVPSPNNVGGMVLQIAAELADHHLDK